MKFYDFNQAEWKRFEEAAAVASGLFRYEAFLRRKERGEMTEHDKKVDSACQEQERVKNYHK